MALGINANRVALGAGILAAAAYFIFSSRQSSAEADMLDWIKDNNPGLSEVEYRSLLAYWLVHAQIMSALQAEEAARLAELAAAAAAADAAAAEAAAAAIIDPTPENNAAAEAAAAASAAALQLYIDGLSTTLVGYEATLNNVVIPRLATAEAAYNQTLDTYIQKKDYIEWRLASTNAQAFVFSSTNYNGDMWGVPWGEFARCTELGIRNDSIESLKVLKGAKLVMYNDINFTGLTQEYDAEETNLFMSTLEQYKNKMSSLKCIPSMNAYIRDRDTAHAAFNTCYTSLVGIQSELVALRVAIYSLSRDIGIITYFSTRADGLLLRIDAIIARLNSQYGV